MTTLIEAAQDVIACANPIGTTSNVRVPKYVMAALEQAIAQERKPSATWKPAPITVEKVGRRRVLSPE